MSERDEVVKVTSALPQAGKVLLSEPTSPIKDESIKEIVQNGENISLETPEQKEAYKRMTPEERAQRRAAIVTALERGVINDRMVVPLPAHMHGEWVRRDPIEIEAMKRLGFEVDNQYAKERALNSDGSSAAIVHDVVFMTCSKENKELIDEVKRLRAYEQANPRGPQREEKELANNINRGGDIKPLTESSTRAARRENIAAAMTEMLTQTQPQIPNQ